MCVAVCTTIIYAINLFRGFGNGGQGGPGFPIYGTKITSRFLTNATRFAIVVHDGILGPLLLEQHNLQCPADMRAADDTRLRDPEGGLVFSKCPSMVRDQDGVEWKIRLFPQYGVWGAYPICPQIFDS